MFKAFYEGLRIKEINKITIIWISMFVISMSMYSLFIFNHGAITRYRIVLLFFILIVEKYFSVYCNIFQQYIFFKMPIFYWPNFLLANKNILLANKEAAYFKDVSECIKKCRYYLKNVLERETIANNGHKKIVKKLKLNNENLFNEILNFN